MDLRLSRWGGRAASSCPQCSQGREPLEKADRRVRTLRKATAGEPTGRRPHGTAASPQVCALIATQRHLGQVLQMRVFWSRPRHTARGSLWDLRDVRFEQGSPAICRERSGVPGASPWQPSDGQGGSLGSDQACGTSLRRTRTCPRWLRPCLGTGRGDLSHGDTVGADDGCTGCELPSPRASALSGWPGAGDGGPCWLWADWEVGEK